MAGATARFVRLLRPDDDDRIVPVGRNAVDDPLRTRRRLAAHDADRLQLVDALGQREQYRDGPERLATEVQVEARADHAAPARDQSAYDVDDAVVEELDLVDADDARLRSDRARDVGGGPHRKGDELIAVVRPDELHAKTVVDRRLEHLDAAAGDDRALHPADQLLALPAEHRSDDDLEAGVAERRRRWAAQIRT